MKDLQNWHCDKCNRVLEICGFIMLNDKNGTELAMYDCPVCGTVDTKQRLDHLTILKVKKSKLKGTFTDRLHHLVALVEETNKYLEVVKQQE